MPKEAGRQRKMRTLLLAALAVLPWAAPATADEVFVDRRSGMSYIEPDGAGANNPMQYVSCEVLGASVRTQGRPDFMKMFVRYTPDIVKPAPGWCMSYVIAGGLPMKPLHVDPAWPINLGKISNKLGVVCTVKPDQMSFTCDWPPYNKATPGAAPGPADSSVQSLIAGWDEQNELCRGSPNATKSCKKRELIHEQLSMKNWCYGRPGEFGYQMNWHECGK